MREGCKFTTRAHAQALWPAPPSPLWRLWLCPVTPYVPRITMREHTQSCAGAVANPAKPFVAIVGGSKVSTKITVVESLMEKAQKIIIGGGMIFTFFKARGLNVSISDWFWYGLLIVDAPKSKERIPAAIVSIAPHTLYCFVCSLLSGHSTFPLPALHHSVLL